MEGIAAEEKARNFLVYSMKTAEVARMPFGKYKNKTINEIDPHLPGVGAG